MAKFIDNEQEAHIEVMTGEIYRYLIGPYQPKVRLLNAKGSLNHVGSRFNKTYKSLRNYFEKENKSPELSATRFQAGFVKDNLGFMKIIVASMWLEENDLSDNNFGLIKVETSEGTIDRFVKIDHGQSLNTMRMQYNIKSFAPIKNYEFELTTDSLKIENAPGQKRLSHMPVQMRKYSLTQNFLENFDIDFLMGRITENYILRSSYQPSAWPLYDQRLLRFMLNKDVKELTMQNKYFVLGLILFTHDKFFSSLIYGSVRESSNFDLKVQITNKIIQRKKEIFDALKNSENFFEFLKEGIPTPKRKLNAEEMG